MLPLIPIKFKLSVDFSENFSIFKISVNFRSQGHNRPPEAGADFDRYFSFFIIVNLTVFRQIRHFEGNFIEVHLTILFKFDTFCAILQRFH